MVTKKREILIKIDETQEITNIVKEIKELEEIVKSQFQEYEEISRKEDEVFENWWYYLEDITHNLEHTTL